MQEVKLPPLHYQPERQHAYWLRRRVPDDLVSIMGRPEFMESLRTRDITEARSKAAFRNAADEALFA